MNLELDKKKKEINNNNTTISYADNPMKDSTNHLTSFQIDFITNYSRLQRVVVNNILANSVECLNS